MRRPTRRRTENEPLLRTRARVTRRRRRAFGPDQISIVAVAYGAFMSLSINDGWTPQ